MFRSCSVNRAHIHNSLVRGVRDPLIGKGDHAKNNQNDANNCRGFHGLNATSGARREAQAPSVTELAMFAVPDRRSERSGTK